MKIIKLLIISLLMAGCTEVQPWEKGDLSRSHMNSDPFPANSHFNQHVFQSKEGASGGYGIAAGGCGCN